MRKFKSCMENTYCTAYHDTWPTEIYVHANIFLGEVPPPLPPSVEEAYRRKCIQLKQRLIEIEAANDASRLRLARTNRSIDRMRLERAFLLEQLAKRTSTNVEDSEGSPSPPPTVRLISSYLYTQLEPPHTDML